jgi:hypothetical protein
MERVKKRTFRFEQKPWTAEQLGLGEWARSGRVSQVIRFHCRKTGETIAGPLDQMHDFATVDAAKLVQILTIALCYQRWDNQEP